MPSLGNSVPPKALTPPKPSSPDRKDNAPTKTHVAPHRQSAGDVARAHGVKRSEIIRANPRLNHQPFLAPKDRVEIPQNEGARSKRHTVQTGETPRTIATQHGVTESALREENGLEPHEDVNPGEELNVPENDNAQDDTNGTRTTRYASADRLERTAANNRLGQTQDPYSTAAERTDAAAERVVETQLPSPETLRRLPPGERDEMVANANQAKAELDQAVKAEVELRTNVISYLPVNHDQLRNAAADTIRSRMAGTEELAAVNGSLERVETTRLAELNKTPLQRAQERTDAAAAEVEETRLPPADVMRRLPSAEQAEMRANANAAQVELDRAVRSEISLTMSGSGTPYVPISADESYLLAVNSVNTRFANSPHAFVIAESVQSARADRTLDIASRQDPATALQTIDELVTSLPSHMQDKVLADSRVEQVVAKAADQATEPLNGDLDANSAGEPLIRSLETMVAMTDGLDPRLANRLVDEGITNIESAFAENGIDPIDIPHREGSMVHMTMLAGRAYEDGQDMALVDRAINLLGGSENWQTNSMIGAISEEGAPPVLALRVGELRGSEDMASEVSFAVQYFADNSVASTYKDFIAANEELSWRIVSLGPLATEEALEKAVTDYINEHPELAETQARFAERGDQLTVQLKQLNALGGDHELDGVVGENIAKVLGQPAAQAAILAAADANPSLLTGEDGLQFLDMTKKVTDVWNNEGDKVMQPFLAQLAERHIFSTYNQKVSFLDPRDPSTYSKAREAMLDLSDPRLARAMGLDEKKLEDLLEEFDNIVQDGRKPKRVRQDLHVFVRDELSGLGLDPSSPAKVAADRLGMIFATTGLLLGARDFANNPSVLSAINATLGVGDVLNAQTMFNGKYAQIFRSPTFGGVLGAAQTIVGFYDAGTRLANGDVGGSLATATGAVGSGMLTAYALGWGSAALGPLGLGLVVFSSFALAHTQRISESNKYMDGTTTKFLEDLGFDKEAAGVLSDQSGEGYNVLPLIAAYGDSNGWSRAETLERINNMTADQLVAFRNVLNHTLDEVDGDISKITATGPTDSVWTNPEGSTINMNKLDTYHLGAVDEGSRWEQDRRVSISPPTSFAEIDALLTLVEENF